MKHLIFLFVALPGFIFAQVTAKQIGDFYIENTTVVYHHVFIDSTQDPAPLLTNKLMTMLAITPHIKNLVQSGNIITGIFDWMNCTTFSVSELKAGFSIEIKNGKYRVSIFDFFQSKGSGLSPWDFKYMRDDKTEWRPEASSDLPNYDTQFTKMFTLPSKESEANW